MVAPLFVCFLEMSLSFPDGALFCVVMLASLPSFLPALMLVANRCSSVCVVVNDASDCKLKFKR